MKRKWWVILSGVLCAALVMGLIGTGDNRLLWTKTFTTPVRVVGLTPDGELAIFISNRLEVLNREGKSRLLREVPDTRGQFVSTPDQGLWFVEESSFGPSVIVKCDWRGTEQWRYETLGPVFDMSPSDDGELLITTRLGTLAMLRADGTQKWSRSIQRPAAFISFVGKGHVAYLDAVKNQLIFLDPDGNELGSHPAMFNRALFALRKPAGGLVGADRTGLFAVDASGNWKWATPLPPAPNTNLLSGMLNELIHLQSDTLGNVLLQHRDGRLHLLDSTGRLRSSHSSLPTTRAAKAKQGRELAEFVLAHQEYQFILENPTNPPAGKVGAAASPARVASLTADGQLRWTQRLPGKQEWKWHQTYWDWRVAWANRFGRNTYQNLSPPLVAPDGTIYVRGFNQQAVWIHAIRGDPPAE
jgi:outer membrane protein assembly factor BamB